MNIAISPDGRKAYIADSPQATNNRVLVVDLTGATPVVGSALAVGDHPDEIAFVPDGITVSVANASDGTITPITVATNAAGTPFSTGLGTHPAKIAITPDGRTAYVTVRTWKRSSPTATTCMHFCWIRIAAPRGGRTNPPAVASNAAQAVPNP